VQNISSADVVAQLRRRFGIRGSSDLSLEESIIPTANLGDLDLPPWHAKRGGLGTISQAAVAAQFSYVGMFMPGGAQQAFTTGVLRRIYLQAPGATDVTMGIFTNAYIGATLTTTGAQGSSWDSVDNNVDASVNGNYLRAAGQVIQAASATDFMPAASTWLALRFTLVAGVTFALDLPFCVRPGNALMVQARTVNVALTGSFLWDEYIAE
jgi:hypothetical protein